MQRMGSWVGMRGELHLRIKEILDFVIVRYVLPKVSTATPGLHSFGLQVVRRMNEMNTNSINKIIRQIGL